MASTPRVWDGVLHRLGAELPAFTLKAWVLPLSLEIDREGARLLCPTAFHRERVRECYLDAIQHHLDDVAGRHLPLELLVGAGCEAEAPTARPEAPPPPAARARPEPAGEQAPARPVPRPAVADSEPRQFALPYTFESFVVGPCNALAREASVAVARGQQERLELLYLASDPGLGKTHLARAVVAEARALGSGPVLYASAEAFTNEFTAAIRSRRMQEFKHRFRRRCRLLVVDDVHFLASKRGTQLELFHTINHLLDAGGRVVLTGDRLPRDIPNLDANLCSRMSAGLVAELEPPDARVRRDILRSKAAAGGVRLPEACLDRMVEALRGSVRDLTGVLVQLVATASLLKRPIDLELTEIALRKVDAPQVRARRLPLQAVVRTVAAFFKTTPQALASRSRRRDVLVPRQLAMYLCLRYSDASAREVAHALGRRHPSVTNAQRVVERDLLERAPLRYQVEALCERLDALARERS